MPEANLIFDTVSIANFCLAEAMPLIEQRYPERAFISSAVYAEILDGISSGHHRLGGIEQAVNRKVMRILEPEAKEYDIYRTLLPRLGRGEASCIAIARCRKMTVATDDRAARSTCAEMKVRFTGTVGILLASAKDGLASLSEADAILARMIAAGFYAPVNSISQIL
jgi:predicted nucleic acid-binding protein